MNARIRHEYLKNHAFLAFRKYDWEILCFISAIYFMPPMFDLSFILFVKHFGESTYLFSCNFKFKKLLVFEKYHNFKKLRSQKVT